MRTQLAVTALLAAAGLHGQTSPAIGTRVPDFQTVYQNGASQTLGSILGPQGALLVFFRSADW